MTSIMSPSGLESWELHEKLISIDLKKKSKSNQSGLNYMVIAVKLLFFYVEFLWVHVCLQILSIKFLSKWTQINSAKNANEM